MSDRIVAHWGKFLKHNLPPSYDWRDGRVVEGAALEMLCGGNFTEGSNPSLSVDKF